MKLYILINLLNNTQYPPFATLEQAKDYAQALADCNHPMKNYWRLIWSLDYEEKFRGWELDLDIRGKYIYHIGKRNKYLSSGDWPRSKFLIYEISVKGPITAPPLSLYPSF